MESPGQAISEAHKRAATPKDRRPIQEWAADDGVILGPPFTRHGPFKVDDTRHLAAPLDSLHDDRKRETNVCAPVRGAKTLIADVDTHHDAAEDPSDTLYLFQDDKAAKDHVEMRFLPTAYRSPKVRDVLPDDKNKERSQEIIFKNGMVLHFKGPADSNLQSRGYRKVKLDEVWLYKEGKIEEARARLGDYQKLGVDKLLCLSQGGIPRSDWDRQFNRGVIQEWHVRCLSCGHGMVPTWRGNRTDGTVWGMRWDTHKTPAGLWNLTKAIPTIRFECEKCGHPHIDSGRTKREWNRLGEYIAEQTTEKLDTKDSFRWTAIIDTPWEYLVDLYLQAVNAWKVGTTEPLVQFFQKRMAQMCNEETLLENNLKFRREKVDLQSKPGDAIRVIAADRQEEDVFWVMACDLHRGTETEKPKIKRIYFNRLESFGAIEALRVELGVQPNHVLIDSGFQSKGDHGVYAMCIRYGWIPVKGVATEGGEPVVFDHYVAPGVKVQRSYSEPVMVDAESGTGPGRFCQMIKFSAPTYTARVSHLIDHEIWVEREGNDPMDQECRKQMAAEYQKEIEVGNKNLRRFKKVWHASKENHARDDAKIIVLSAVLQEVLPDLESLAS